MNLIENWSKAIKWATLLSALFFAPVDASAGTIPTMTFFEGFEDDFAANRNTPDLAVPSLSSAFESVNGPPIPGTLAIRDRTVFEGDPVGPALDFSFGSGGTLTLAFTTPFVAARGSTIDFDVIIFGGDRNSLFKYVSNDGVNFTQVGDTSDDATHYQFDLMPGGTTTYFRLIENGNGLWVDNFGASIVGVPEPASVLAAGCLICLFLATRSKNGCRPRRLPLKA